MKTCFFFISIIYFVLSCSDEKISTTTSMQTETNRILIGTVATENSPAKFYEVDDPRVVEKYFKIFVDTVKWNAHSSGDYDHRIQFFRGDEIVEQIYVNEDGHGYSFRGSKNIQNGIVRSQYWDSLAPYMKEREYETYVFPTLKKAEAFYQLAKSKKAFVSAPYFCPWRKYDGELFVKTNIDGEPVTTDSMRSIIQAKYPNEEFEVEPADLIYEFSTPSKHERFKITCSYEFFKNFEFRGRTFTEVENPDFIENGGDYLFKSHYVPYMLSVPLNSPTTPSKKSSPRKEEPPRELPQEYFVKFAPVIQFVGSKSAKKDLEELLIKE